MHNEEYHDLNFSMLGWSNQSSILTGYETCMGGMRNAYILARISGGKRHFGDYAE
jgi:hypothetical protein